jgi:hypothetical protein
MPRDKRPDPRSTAARAKRLEELLDKAQGKGKDAEDAELAALAARHLARTRRAPAQATVAPRKTPPQAPRSYVHDKPTRSGVLNAFLHELGGEGLVPVGVDVPEEHALPARLMEFGRKYMAPMAAAAGSVEAALRLAAETQRIENERAARLFLRQASRAGGAGELLAIARDYEAHRERAGKPEQDDLLGACMMAAFAGKLCALAERMLGTYVRDELRVALRTLVRDGRPRTRHPGVRERKTPGEAAPREAPATAEVNRPKRRR